MIRAKANELRRARVTLGYNQSDVCEGTGLNITTYCNIESGKVGLRPKTAKRICLFLSRSFDDLFEFVSK